VENLANFTMVEHLILTADDEFTLKPKLIPQKPIASINVCHFSVHPHEITNIFE
jgi:hypothetical protein